MEAKGAIVRATLILNPTAGQKSDADNLAAARAYLQEHGWTVRNEETSGPGAATALAREAVQRADDVVIVAGGDGTINETVQGLAGSTTALGVLPLGTANVWAREIGVPSNPLGAAQALAEGHCRPVDLGRVGERYFLLMVGVGFDGAVTGLVEPRLKKRMGRWAYVVTAARLSLRYGGPEVTLQLDSETVRCRLLLAVIGNTRLYGGRLAITTSAVADDGLLDVVVFPGRRLWQALPSLVPLLTRRHPFASGALYYRTRHLHITSAHPLPLQADGDYVGETPVVIAVAPSALRVIVPRTTRSPLFRTPAPPRSVSGQ